MGDSKITFILSAIDRGASKTAGRVGKAIGGIEGAGHRAGRGIKALGGAMMALGKIGVLVLLTALAAATAAMANAVKGAIEEEKGIARLNAALKANVKGWDGNTVAIEKAIDKRMALAFTDDELRRSMGTLVTATGSVSQAMRIQTVAMDLARQKGISLDDASKLLIKAQNGNTRALKELGIVLPKTATATEILAAVQKKTAGQAEAYGKTTAGAFLNFQIAMGELLEDVAVKALPLLTGLAQTLSTKVIPAVSGVIANISRWVSENRPLIDQIIAFAGGALKTLATAIGNVISWIGMLVAKITSNKDAMNFLRTVVGFIAKAFDLVTTALGFVIGKIGGWVDKMSKNKAVINGFKTLVSGIATAFGHVRSAIGFVIDKIKVLIGWVRQAITWLGKLADKIGAGIGGPGATFSKDGIWTGVPGMAAGGPIRANTTRLVGEDGPELFRPSVAGAIVPNHKLGGSGPTIVVNYSPQMSTASPIEAQRFAQAIIPELTRALQRLG